MSHPHNRLNATRLDSTEAPREPQGLTLTPSAVSEEPIDKVVLENFLRVENPQPFVLDTLIESVRIRGEKLSRRLFTQRSVDAEWSVFYRRVALPRPPVDSVSSVEYYDRDTQTWETVDSADYELRSDVLTLDDGVGGQPLRVTYTAGYDSLPAPIEQQMLEDVRYTYDHRDPADDDSVRLKAPDVYQEYRPY